MWMATVIFVILFNISNIQCGLFNIGAPRTTDSFGAYDVTWKYFGVCPMSGSHIAQTDAKLVKENNLDIGYINLTFPVNVRLDEMKLLAYSIKNNKKTVVWNYKINKPCQHEMFANVIRNQMGSRSCLLKQGEYTCKVNFSDGIRKFYGPMFYFGEYMFKVSALSKKQIVTCMVFHELLTPKD